MDYKTDFYSAENDNVSYSSGSEKNQLERIKQSDRGYCKIYKNVLKNERFRRTKIELYTTSSVGNHIRDAETGEYYPYLVGSSDEHLFFSVILATGVCKSKNGSNTLFYLSPEKFMNHMHVHLDNDIIMRWREKRDNRLRENNMKKTKQANLSSVVVK